MLSSVIYHVWLDCCDWKLAFLWIQNSVCLLDKNGECMAVISLEAKWSNEFPTTPTADRGCRSGVALLLIPDVI